MRWLFVTSFVLKGIKMEKLSFKERVRQTVIRCSKNYKLNYAGYDYLICSEAFIKKDYYIISAHEDNYQHLTGVHSLISPKNFFLKCLDGSLSVSDFDFIKKGQSEKSVKGSVREKMAVFDMMTSLFFCDELYTEESFQKNKVCCSFATAVNSLTLGFSENEFSTPKTLLKNNHLKKSYAVDLIIRKSKSEKCYDEIIFINSDKKEKYYNKIRDLLSDNLLTYFEK